MKIYISGQITGIKGYIDKFKEAEHKLTEMGYTVINPARVNAQLPEGLEHREYMLTSIAMLEMCDVIFLMDGWEKSKGCSIEFEYARNNGITMLFENGRSGISVNYDKEKDA